jgi:actin-related protein
LINIGSKSILDNIILSGGTTMFDGFADRLRHDVKESIIKNVGIRNANPNIIVPDNRQDCVWRGGSVIGSLSTFEQMMVTIDEYYENGPSIMNTKTPELGPL